MSIQSLDHYLVAVFPEQTYFFVYILQGRIWKVLNEENQVSPGPAGGMDGRSALQGVGSCWGWACGWDFTPQVEGEDIPGSRCGSH